MYRDTECMCDGSGRTVISHYESFMADGHYYNSSCITYTYMTLYIYIPAILLVYIQYIPAVRMTPVVRWKTDSTHTMSGLCRWLCVYA